MNFYQHNKGETEVKPTRYKIRRLLADLLGAASLAALVVAFMFILHGVS